MTAFLTKQRRRSYARPSPKRRTGPPVPETEKARRAAHAAKLNKAREAEAREAISLADGRGTITVDAAFPPDAPWAKPVQAPSQGKESGKRHVYTGFDSRVEVRNEDLSDVDRAAQLMEDLELEPVSSSLKSMPGKVRVIRSTGRRK